MPIQDRGNAKQTVTENQTMLHILSHGNTYVVASEMIIDICRSYLAEMAPSQNGAEFEAFDAHPRVGPKHGRSSGPEKKPSSVIYSGTHIYHL